VAQVAQELDLSERTIWRFIRARMIAVHKFGNSTRVKREDLDGFISRCKTSKPASKRAS
jgi:excisionase family DNA binding protein